MEDSNRLSGSEKDKLRKKFGHNRLTGFEKDFGRNAKAKAITKMKGESHLQEQHRLRKEAKGKGGHLSESGFIVSKNGNKVE